MLEVVRYPHPTLRHKSKPLRRVDGEVEKIVAEMFDLMYRENGVGLAANQVDLPYRLFIINLEADPQKAEEFVFINPVIARRGGAVEAEEGCLSFPDIFAPVKRPAKVAVSAYNLSGEEVEYQLDGLFARAVQHEYDHLDGVVFIDRLSSAALFSVKEALTDLELEFQGRRQRGSIPGDDRIFARLAELESLRAICD